MSKGFFAKKSAPANVALEEQQTSAGVEATIAELIGDGEMNCTKHGQPGKMICDCTTEPICEKCYSSHQGTDHKKMFIKDISKAFPTMMSKKIDDNNNFYKGYKTSLSGKYFEGYVNFFENVIDAAHTLREEYDKQDPFKQQTPFLLDFLDAKREMEELNNEFKQLKKRTEKDYFHYYKDFNGINKRLQEAKEELFKGQSSTAKIIELEWNEEETKEVIEDYVEQVFLEVFVPEKARGGKNLPITARLNKNVRVLSHEARPKKKNPYASYTYVEPEFDPDAEFFFPEIEEDFEVNEGNSYKGHKGTVRGIQRINHNEFVSVDDSGQVIMWNKKDNKMKGFNLKDIGNINEPLLCCALTEDRGKFLVCGMRKGYILIYNRAKGGKKIIHNATKKQSDIVAIADLELMNSKYFLVQDNRYYIRMYSADSLFYDIKFDETPKPLLEIPQKLDPKIDEMDVYFGDGKLIELNTTDFASNKSNNISFIASCVATQKTVNIYVIDGVITRCFCCITRAPVQWRFSHIRSITFEHSPTSILELSHNRIAVATGLEIEIVDVHNEDKVRIFLDGHQERIRSLTMMSRKTKVIARSKKSTQEIVQNTDFILSTGDDKTVRIWKIPSPLTLKEMKRRMRQQDEEEDIEYCVLDLDTQHHDCIYSVIYLHEAFATGGRDGQIKVFNLNLSFKKVR